MSLGAAPFGHAGTLTPLTLAQVCAAAGPWRCGGWLGPFAFADRHMVDALVGIYLICDDRRRLVYVGQARRDGGVLARLDCHARDPLKREVFADVRVLRLHDHCDADTVDAVEGRVADDLRLRGRLHTGRRRRVWPSAARWTELVAGAAAANRARLVAV